MEDSYKNKGCNFTTVWEACCGPVYLVMDEEGRNVGNAQIRHFLRHYWLYVDEQDGYSLMHEDDVDSLILEAAP